MLRILFWMWHRHEPDQVWKVAQGLQACEGKGGGVWNSLGVHTPHTDISRIRGSVALTPRRLQFMAQQLETDKAITYNWSRSISRLFLVDTSSETSDRTLEWLDNSTTRRPPHHFRPFTPKYTELFYLGDGRGGMWGSGWLGSQEGCSEIFFW